MLQIALPAHAPHGLPPFGFDDGAAEAAGEATGDAAGETAGDAAWEGTAPHKPYATWQPVPQCKSDVPHQPRLEQQ